MIRNPPYDVTYKKIYRKPIENKERLEIIATLCFSCIGCSRLYKTTYATYVDVDDVVKYELTTLWCDECIREEITNPGSTQIAYIYSEIEISLIEHTRKKLIDKFSIPPLLMGDLIEPTCKKKPLSIAGITKIVLDKHFSDIHIKSIT